MADMITRCPKCATAFRISEAHIKSATGAVRCGSCLSVFHARDNLVSLPASPEDAAPPHPNVQDSAQRQGQENSAAAAPGAVGVRPATKPVIDEPAPQESQAPEAIPSADEAPGHQQHVPVDQHDHEAYIANDQFADDPSDFIDDRESPLAPSTKTSVIEDGDENDDEPGEDEAWVLELLEEDSDLETQFKKVIEKKIIEKKVIEAQANQTRASAADTPASAALKQRTDEADLAPQPETDEDRFTNSSAERAENVADLQSAHSLRRRSTDNAQTAAPTASENDVVPRKDESVAPAAPTPAPATETTQTERSSPQPKRKPEGSFKILHQVIDAIQPEPLEVDWPEDASPWRKRLLWPLLILAALAVLVGQVAWLEFDRLNRIEPYRTFYGFVCNTIGCSVPALIDREQIQTSNLTVRSHAELADTLMVDVILQNNAPFEQPFPALVLTFTNLEDEPVAVRRFTSEDYLGGELAGRDEMPVKQPIHIGLEIVDPGPAAVSYSIAIVD